MDTPTGCDVASRAKLAAASSAYEGVWAEFLNNRGAKAADRAKALLQVLSSVPEGKKGAEDCVVEADFCYILGAVFTNDPAHLERAVYWYDRALSVGGAEGGLGAARMRSEALLRLGRYDEAFAAFGCLSVRPEHLPFEELEAAPFRMRHDAALCERLAKLGRLAGTVASQASAALRAVADRVERSPLPGGRQRWPRVADLSAVDREELRRGLYGELPRASAGCPTACLDRWAMRPSVDTPCQATLARDPLSSTVDWAKAVREYRQDKVTVVDGFFEPDALEELWRFSREATCFRTVRNGFLGAFPGDGNVHPIVLAAARSLENHMNTVLDGHPLGLWWFFKYTGAGRSGIGIHADAAAVNVNIWLTPDEARGSGGGLDVYTSLPPSDTDVMAINREFANAAEEAEFRDELLKAGPVRRVEYKRNRAVIFVSDLYHASQPHVFTDPEEQPRVNLTLLFGDRPMIGHGGQGQPAAQAGEVLASPGTDAGTRDVPVAVAKRAREEPIAVPFAPCTGGGAGDGWDLFD